MGACDSRLKLATRAGPGLSPRKVIPVGLIWSGLYPVCPPGTVVNSPQPPWARPDQKRTAQRVVKGGSRCGQRKIIQTPPPLPPPLHVAARRVVPQ